MTTHRGRTQPGRSRHRLYALGSFVVVLTIAVALALSGIGNPPASTVQVGAALQVPPPAGVTDLGEPPVQLFGDVVAWTGSSLLSFGGAGAPGAEENVGASFEPASGAWRVWAQPPFDPPLAPGMAGVWTGEELVVVGVLCSNTSAPTDEEMSCFPGNLAAAAYNPDENSWRSVPAPAAPPDSFVKGNAGSVGNGAIGWTGTRALFDIAGSLVAFDPDQTEWTTLPSLETPGSRCLSASTLVVADTREDPSDPVRTPVVLQLLDPDMLGWTPVPLDATGPLAWWEPVCTEDGVLVFDLGLTSLWHLDLSTLQWTELPSPPPELARQPPPDGALPGVTLPTLFSSRQWTGRELVFWNHDRSRDLPGADGSTRHVNWPGYAIALDPAKGEWRRASAGPRLDPRSPNQAWGSGYGFVVGAANLTVYAP